MLEVLIDHEDALVLVVPAQARLHANDLAVICPREERPGQRGVHHVHEPLHGEEERKVVRVQGVIGLWELQLVLKSVILHHLFLLHL